MKRFFGITLVVMVQFLFWACADKKCSKYESCYAIVSNVTVHESIVSLRDHSIKVSNVNSGITIDSVVDLEIESKNITVETTTDRQELCENVDINLLPTPHFKVQITEGLTKKYLISMSVLGGGDSTITVELLEQPNDSITFNSTFSIISPVIVTKIAESDSTLSLNYQFNGGGVALDFDISYGWKDLIHESCVGDPLF
ncbi:MAG: hypothetical protein OCD76_08900 [Reichenbachiella sp.]